MARAFKGCIDDKGEFHGAGPLKLRHAAIDDQFGADDIAAFGRRQEHDRIRDFKGLRHPLQRHLGCHLAFHTIGHLGRQAQAAEAAGGGGEGRLDICVLGHIALHGDRIGPERFGSAVKRDAVAVDDHSFCALVYEGLGSGQPDTGIALVTTAPLFVNRFILFLLVPVARQG
jgi:hypothetical protein